MNRADLQTIQSYQGYPSLTITLPTHRTSPDNKQDPIRVRNLVTQMTNRLLEEFSRREVEPLLKALDELVNEIDYRYTLDGLVIFVNQDVAQKHYLPFTLPERVIIDENFFTRDLVFALNRSPRYWVLALSEQPTRLFEGVRGDLEEVRYGAFPMTHGGPGGATTLPSDPAVNASLYRDEHHRAFFRNVDNELTAILAKDPLPIALVGVDRYLSFFSEVARNADKVIASLRGNHDTTSAHELGKLIWPPVKEALAAQRKQVLDELDAAIGAQRCASTIGEVWRLAHEGRGAVLIVEEDFHYPARVAADGMGLEPIETPTDPTDLDDAVDEVIEIVLAKGGRVVFVDDGTLPQHDQIALILRY